MHTFCNVIHFVFIYLFLFLPLRTHKCAHCRRIQHKVYVKWKQRLAWHFRHDSIEIHRFDELSEAQGIFVVCVSLMGQRMREVCRLSDSIIIYI